MFLSMRAGERLKTILRLSLLWRLSVKTFRVLAIHGNFDRCAATCKRSNSADAPVPLSKRQTVTPIAPALR